METPENKPNLPELLKKLREGKLKPLDLLKYAPNPPRLSPTLNRIIDETVHPLAEKHSELYVLDSLLHLTVELADTAVASLAKTVRYNLEKIIEKKKV